jgi:DNA invertase Pin-like site-specific DNA recombinase
MTTSQANKPLSFDGYVRVSDVNGRGGESYRSPSDQRAIIERLAGQFGLALGEVVSEEDVKGSTPIEERELGRLVRKVEEGRSGGLIVWNVKRYSRNWRDGILVADRIFAAGGRLLAEDFQHVGMGARSMLSFILELGEEDLRQKTETWDRSTAGAVARGIHSGSVPPLGYAWPVTVIELGDGRRRVKKLGPLEPTGDAARVRAAFEARAAGAPWSEVARILGVRSKSAAAAVLSNRVYLGEARAGRHVRQNAHPALVDEILFARVQRKAETTIRDTSKRETLLAKVLKCGSCGQTLTYDGSMAKPGYRCKNLQCEQKVSLAACKIEPVVLELALGWHRIEQPWFALTRAVEDALLPAHMDALAAARAEVESLREQIASGAISPSAGAVALTAAEKAVEQAREKVETAEAGTGWLALTPERVADKLGLRTETLVETKPLLLGAHLGSGVHEPAPEGETFESVTERVVGWDADAETVRSFIREMGVVQVYPVGRGHGNLPVRSRIRWQPNTPVVDYTALPESVLEAERAEFLAAVEAYRAKTAG